MPTFKPSKSDHVLAGLQGKKVRVLNRKLYDSFNSSLLGLGELTQTSTSIDAIAAIFDLEGFTNFCKQIEPHLAVPFFLNEFLTWLMEELKSQMTRKEYKEGFQLWSPLPFLIKFMGDGLLVLWDSSMMSDVSRQNVIVSASEICDNYVQKFLKSIKGKVVDPPTALRCGLARGTVYSVGDGNDYVGSCINMAARIQKMPGITFSFNRRGFNLEDSNTDIFFRDDIVVKQVSIRGIGENELIMILKEEFEAMKAGDKKQYRPV